MVVVVVMVRRRINTTHRVGQMSECCRLQTAAELLHFIPTVRVHPFLEV
jgi:hypothetical protein